MTGLNTQVAYVGIYPPSAPRDKVYIEALKRRGFEFIECVDASRGVKKYFKLYRALKSLSDIDLVWVGYLSPLAVLVSSIALRKKILYNALASSYESYVLDRRVCPTYSPRAFLFWLSDFLAFHFADVVLLESEAQKRFISRTFFVRSNKLEVVYTGADEEIFHSDPSVQKEKRFTVAFRGQFLPATGVEVVLDAAKLLTDEPIRFWISGWGQLQDEVLRYIVTNKLENVELNTVFLSPEVLRRKLLSAHVLLGQFSANPRLDRTIQHKTIEAMAFGMPYITRDSESNRELLADGVNCIFVQPADPKALVEAILRLKKDENLRERISQGVVRTYTVNLAPKVLVDKVQTVISELIR